MSRRKTRRPAREILVPENPYLEAWLALTPAERQRRAWRLRRRIPNLQAVHDAKTFPKL